MYNYVIFTVNSNVINIFLLDNVSRLFSLTDFSVFIFNGLRIVLSDNTIIPTIGQSYN